MQEDISEKRRYPRLDFHIPMSYRKIESDTNEFKGSLMKNISQGGAMMTIYEFLPKDLKLAMQIPLVTGARPVEGVGRVAWAKKAAFSEQYDVGLEFINLSQKDATQINEFIFNDVTR